MVTNVEVKLSPHECTETLIMSVACGWQLVTLQCSSTGITPSPHTWLQRDVKQLVGNQQTFGNPHANLRTHTNLITAYNINCVQNFLSWLSIPVTATGNWNNRQSRTPRISIGSRFALDV